jgi:hypothetical protein
MRKFPASKSALPMDQQWTARWTNFDPQNTNYLTAVHEPSNNRPERFELHQNFPNPFNPNTTIEFSVQGSGFVSLKVFDLLGREVATLVNQELIGGSYTVNFNAAHLASGSYVYRLATSAGMQTRRMMLVK